VSLVVCEVFPLSANELESVLLLELTGGNRSRGINVLTNDTDPPPGVVLEIAETTASFDTV